VVTVTALDWSRCTSCGKPLTDPKGTGIGYDPNERHIGPDGNPYCRPCLDEAREVGQPALHVVVDDDQDEPPLEDEPPEPPTPPDPDAPTPGTVPSHPLHAVSIEEFAAVAEDGAAPLLGEAAQVLIPENSDVMIYGDGGAGKTTLAIDLAVHWASGTNWLSIVIPRPVTSLIIENEGPRPLLREKLSRKLAGWTGAAPSGRARIIDEPWAGFTLANEPHRQQLADMVAHDGIDVVIIGPIVCAGMVAAGTLQDVREFLGLVSDVRRRAGRRVTFVLIHHENRAGKVSGAWEGAADTLIHVTGMGHGHTRLHIQKARWASDHHAQTINLAWTGQDGYLVEEKPERTDEDIAAAILDAVSRHPGTGWTAVEKATPGVADDRRRKIRDRLLTDGQLVNIGKVDGAEVWLTECPARKTARLYLPDDPTIRHLRRDPDAAQPQSAALWGEAG
jgi:hypothetical protein